MKKSAFKIHGVLNNAERGIMYAKFANRWLYVIF